MAPSMTRAAAMSGMAPSKALATSMRILRSFLATITSTPSPTSRRPIFQVLPTRLANDAMSSGAVVGTISTTTCAPRVCSSVCSCVSNAALSEALRVPVWSMTGPVSTGTGNRPPSACAHGVANAINNIAISALQISARGIFSSNFQRWRVPRSRLGLGRGEIHGGRRGDLGFVGHGEAGLGRIAERDGGQVCGKAAREHVVFLHRLDVAVARHGDAVLGAFQRHAQVAKALVGLQRGIALG